MGHDTSRKEYQYTYRTSVLRRLGGCLRSVQAGIRYSTGRRGVGVFLLGTVFFYWEYPVDKENLNTTGNGFALRSRFLFSGGGAHARDGVCWIARGFGGCK